MSELDKQIDNLRNTVDELQKQVNKADNIQKTKVVEALDTADIMNFDSIVNLAVSVIEMQNLDAETALNLSLKEHSLDVDNDSYFDSISESIDNKIGESMKNYVFSSIMKLEDQNPLHKRKKSLTKLRTFNSNSLSNKIRNDTICNFSTNNTVVNTENNRSTLSNSLLFKKSYFCKYKTPGKKNKINLRGKYKNRFSFPKRKFRQEENNENQCIFV